jgi:hypothetical protein
MTRKQIFWFWGTMDAIYLARYVINSVLGGRIPYLSDIENALWVLREHSAVQLYMFASVLFLQASIVVSCLMFFLQKEWVKGLVYLQAPLRLAFLIPSVSLLLIGAQLAPNYNWVLMAVLVVISEIVKVWSVWRWSKKADISSRPEASAP